MFYKFIKIMFQQSFWTNHQLGNVLDFKEPYEKRTIFWFLFWFSNFLYYVGFLLFYKGWL
jgi:hypothetical protein